MAYTDDAVKAKLSAMNETQESIVTVAQWVMFHRRHADRTGTIWLQKLKEAGASKRLNLIYLANGNQPISTIKQQLCELILRAIRGCAAVQSAEKG